MKKIIFIIVLAVICAMLPVNVFAEAKNFSQSEAEELATDAIHMLLRTQYNEPSYHKTIYENGRYIWDWNQYITLDSFVKNLWGAKEYGSFSENLAGEKIYDNIHGPTDIYGVVYAKDVRFTEDIKNVEDFYTYLETVFYGDLSIKLRYFRQTNRDLVRPDDEGNLLYLKMCDQGFYMLEWGIIGYRRLEQINNDKYSLVVILGKHDAFSEPGDYESTHIYLPCYETIEFTNTENGWRVSGGTAFEVMLGDREPNPNTSDPSAIAIPALTAAAVISLALPMGIVRRRRRYA